MDRRAFISGALGLLAAPLAARAQPAGKVYRIGILGNVPLTDPEGAKLWGAFVRGLHDLGYVEGQNLTIEHQSSEGQYERVPALAGALVRLKVDVIVVPTGQNALALNCQEIVHPGRLCDGGGCRPTIPAEEEARMNIHKNARTTPRSRGQIVARVLTQQEAPAAVAAAVGVSERTVRKWVARYAAEAEAGLADRTCRPRRSPGATPRLLVSWVEQLRRQRWTGAAIAEALQLSASTVARLLRRQGLARLRTLDPPVPVQRYQWARPGDLLHLDVKKLGRIGRVGHRIHGDRRSRVRGIGWEYVHVAIDDASRLAYVEVLPDEGEATTTQFLWRARAWFRRHGIRVRRVLTDNGSAYRSARFARLCSSAGLRHLRTRPYTPRTNGKAERFIQTLLREWAYRRAYPSSRHRTEALPAWLYYYNWERGHGALHGRPPMSCLVAPNNLVAVHT